MKRCGSDKAGKAEEVVHELQSGRMVLLSDSAKRGELLMERLLNPAELKQHGGALIVGALGPAKHHEGAVAPWIRKGSARRKILTMPCDTMLAKQGFKQTRAFVGDVFDNQYLFCHDEIQ